MQVSMGMGVRADAAVPSCRGACSFGSFCHHQRQPGLTNLRQHGMLADALLVTEARFLRGRQSRSLPALRRVERLTTTSCQASACFGGTG